MAIAVNQGHVSRAIDFYNAERKYFCIGGSVAWDNEDAPPAPSSSDFKLVDIIALKRVDNCYLVIPDSSGSINYRGVRYRIVTPSLETTLNEDIVEGVTTISVTSTQGLSTGSKVRVGNVYESTIKNIINSNSITLNDPAPEFIASGSKVLSGAYVEQAKYVYIDCTLDRDSFPVESYRQIGLCTNVIPATGISTEPDVMRSAKYSTTNMNEFTDYGILEILDNRKVINRQTDQSESLSLLLEF